MNTSKKFIKCWKKYTTRYRVMTYKELLEILNAQIGQEVLSLGITSIHSMHMETNDDGMKLI